MVVGLRVALCMPLACLACSGGEPAGGTAGAGGSGAASRGGAAAAAGDDESAGAAATSSRGGATATGDAGSGAASCGTARAGAWVAMSTEDAPPGGLATTARWWTGSELVLRDTSIWHAYDPCTDHWRALSTLGRPLFAETYPADFDGRRLVVLQVFPSTGGDNPVAFGVYDFDTDSWSEPSQLGMHTSADRAQVLTGEQAILWGGRDPFDDGGGLMWTSSGSGSVFDFETGVWRAIRTEGAPAARVVTPTMYDFEDGRMVIWGGRVAKRVYSNELSQQEYDACDPNTGACPLLATGGIYELASDSWEPIPDRGAPPARNTPIVEWYRGKVLVLLGQSYPDGNTWTAFNDGGLYDPETQQWTLFDGPAELGTPASDGSGWHHAWIEGELWVADGNSGDWILDPETLTWRAAPIASAEARCSPFGATHPVCRDARGASYLALPSAPGESWDVRELPPYLDEWAHPLEFWTGSQLIRWGGQHPDPAWMQPPGACAGLPACDLIGAPQLPNATGGVFTP